MHALHLDTTLSKNVTLLFQKLESKINLDMSVEALIAGGVAIHFYTGTRIARDVDVQFSPYVLIPENLMVEVDSGEGLRRPLYFDVGHNLNFSLMHQDYLKDSIPLDLGLEFIRPYLLSPVDLVLSKISRLSEIDQRDIIRLSQLGLITPDAIERRSNEAMEGCICNRSDLHAQIQTVLRLIE